MLSFGRVRALIAVRNEVGASRRAEFDKEGAARGTYEARLLEYSVVNDDLL